MATLFNSHSSALHLPRGEGYPKGCTLKPGRNQVRDGYFESIRGNHGVQIFVAKGWISAGTEDLDADAPLELPETLVGVNATQAQTAIRAATEPDLLERWRREEEQGAARKTVLGAIDNRLEALLEG